MHIILSELYCGQIHGNPLLDGHYLVIGRFCPYTYKIYEEEEEEDEDEYESPTLYSIAEFYRNNYNININHSVIRNYNNIVSSSSYFAPQLAECIVLPSQETIAVIKTMWIKLIQRRWKKIYSDRKKMLNNLIITNKFQLNRRILQKLPGIHGMLHDLYDKNTTNK